MTKRHLPDSAQNSLRMQVYDYITAEMDKGNYSPGSYIPLNELAKEMGLSKTPLREAMIRLESEGFVTIYPRKGVVVNRFELEDCRYLFGVIGTLESEMISANSPLFDELVIARMRELCRDMRKALDEDDFAAYDAAHWEYHQVFLEMADNVFVERIIAPIKHRLWDFPKRGFSKQWLIMACDEHEGILDALEQGNVDEAKRIVREQHWSYEYNEEYIRKVYFPYLRGK